MEEGGGRCHRFAKRFTNHRERSTAVTSLANCNTPEDQVMLMTGHGNARSLKPYTKVQAACHSELVAAMRPAPLHIETAGVAIPLRSFPPLTSPQVPVLWMPLGRVLANAAKTCVLSCMMLWLWNWACYPRGTSTGGGNEIVKSPPRTRR